MPTGIVLTPPTQVLPDTPAPKKTLGLQNTQPKHTATPTHELELLFSPPERHPAIPSIHLQIATDRDDDAVSAVPQGEDEYTLSAYGDISLSEVIVPPLPAPTAPTAGLLQPRCPPPRLRLKVRRPPMPKRRLSYTYIPDPLPHSEGMDPDERWPGSPRPFANSPPWLQRQPLVSPLSVDPTTSQTQPENRPVKKGGSSLERLFDELVPRSPSIRLSPPGSPASQALGLPRERFEQKSSVREGRDVSETDDTVKVPQTSGTPAPLQGQPKEAAWRTRLPPRLPIPKWDI
ncbi:hypothetical protein HD554DRAFT_2096478 [Boletus coccyginus]|nr:hypothetical protein HD554DRAFT_2096478 [Boletus coccyginus]